MAASFAPTIPNTPLSSRKREGSADLARLPSGPCNYRDLSAGENAPRCGCRRFWDQAVSSPRLGDVNASAQPGSRAGWCMCEHHACFHDHQPVSESERQALTDTIGLSGSAIARDEPIRQQVVPSLNLQDPGARLQVRTALGQSIVRGPESLPDTLQWDRFINSGPGASQGGLPPIPSQCLMSQNTSFSGSVDLSGYARPFGGLGLQTLNHIPRPYPTRVDEAVNNENVQPHPGRAMQIYEDPACSGYVQSLTEVATPSLRCSQDVDNGDAFEQNASEVKACLQRMVDERAGPKKKEAFVERKTGLQYIKQSQSSPTAPLSPETFEKPERDEYLLPQIRSIVNHVSNYPVTMQNHETRLDLLENASFSNAGIEELHDRHENLDTRVLELESRVEEVEKIQAAANDASSVGSRQRLDESMDSRMSDISSSSAMGRSSYRSRFEALEAQVSDLQAMASPSYKNPWAVEVVYLPFGFRLHGIWSSKHSFSQRSRTMSVLTDDWTQVQENNTMAVAQAQLSARGNVPSWEETAIDDEGDRQDWLVPRACALRSKVDERLRSRGLVKTIQITGPDARDFQSAMVSAFGDLPSQIADEYGEIEVPDTLSPYLGLHVPWIPLRKVHKDSCLRFLDPSEMLTPALWTVPWLQSSVAMRSSTRTRRLYVTQRDSYVQHLGEHVANWTWQKLRELPRVYHESQSSAEVFEADAQETCWEYDERLDPPPSVHSSFTSQHSCLSIRPYRYEQEAEPVSPSDHFSSAAASPAASTTATTAPATRPISPLKERHPFRPLRSRTISMPSLAPTRSSPSQGTTSMKKRIASFDQEVQSSPIKAVHTAVLKRRRISRSPSRPRDTPRWSVGPPSPFTFEEPNHVERKRGTTPFAYATPHSNAPYIDASRTVEQDVDQDSVTDDLREADDYLVDQNYDSESAFEQPGSTDQVHLPDEWEVVVEGNDSHQSGRVLFDGQDENEENDEIDDKSDVSSQPSEYPSTHQPPSLFPVSKGVGFEIHVDEELFDDQY